MFTENGSRRLFRQTIRQVAVEFDIETAKDILFAATGGRATKVSDVPDNEVRKVTKMARFALTNRRPKPYHSSVMKISMLLHFATTVGPYAPESARTSRAYTKFVKELLADGMIERPTPRERAIYHGWAYTATEKGRVYVEALKRVPLPVSTTPKWIMPS